MNFQDNEPANELHTESNDLTSASTSVIEPFIEIQNEDGTTTKIRKSTFVWLLTESKGKLSSDRLKRLYSPKHFIQYVNILKMDGNFQLIQSIFQDSVHSEKHYKI